MTNNSNSPLNHYDVHVNNEFNLPSNPYDNNDSLHPPLRDPYATSFDSQYPIPSPYTNNPYDSNPLNDSYEQKHISPYTNPTKDAHQSPNNYSLDQHENPYDQSPYLNNTYDRSPYENQPIQPPPPVSPPTPPHRKIIEPDPEDINRYYPDERPLHGIQHPLELLKVRKPGYDQRMTILNPDGRISVYSNVLFVANLPEDFNDEKMKNLFNNKVTQRRITSFPDKRYCFITFFTRLEAMDVFYILSYFQFGDQQKLKVSWGREFWMKKEEFDDKIGLCTLGFDKIPSSIIVNFDHSYIYAEDFQKLFNKELPDRQLRDQHFELIPPPPQQFQMRPPQPQQMYPHQPQQRSYDRDMQRSRNYENERDHRDMSYDHRDRRDYYDARDRRDMVSPRNYNSPQRDYRRDSYADGRDERDRNWDRRDGRDRSYNRGPYQ